jgi:hypothetical protein
MVNQFTYFGTILTKKSCISKEIKSRLKRGNACLSVVVETSVLQSAIQNVNIKTCRRKTLPVVLYICETYFVSLTEKHRLRVLEDRVPRDTLKHKKNG